MIAVANSVVQGVLIAVAAVIFAAVVTVVFRRSLVSFRYWFGWLAVASVLLAAGVVLAVIPDVESLPARCISATRLFIANSTFEIAAPVCCSSAVTSLSCPPVDSRICSRNDAIRFSRTLPATSVC